MFQWMWQTLMGGGVVEHPTAVTDASHSPVGILSSTEQNSKADRKHKVDETMAAPGTLISDAEAVTLDGSRSSTPPKKKKRVTSNATSPPAKRPRRVTPTKETIQPRALATEFSDGTPFSNKFDKLYPTLAAFQKKHGHCRVKPKCPNDPELGAFVLSLRKRHRKKIDSQLGLSESQVRQLDDIGFAWKSSGTKRK